MFRYKIPPIEHPRAPAVCTSLVSHLFDLTQASTTAMTMTTTIATITRGTVIPTATPTLPSGEGALGEVVALGVVVRVTTCCPVTPVTGEPPAGITGVGKVVAVVTTSLLTAVG